MDSLRGSIGFCCSVAIGKKRTIWECNFGIRFNFSSSSLEPILVTSHILIKKPPWKGYFTTQTIPKTINSFQVLHLEKRVVKFVWAILMFHLTVFDESQLKVGLISPSGKNSCEWKSSNKSRVFLWTHLVTTTYFISLFLTWGFVLT